MNDLNQINDSKPHSPASSHRLKELFNSNYPTQIQKTPINDLNYNYQDNLINNEIFYNQKNKIQNNFKNKEDKLSNNLKDQNFLSESKTYRPYTKFRTNKQNKIHEINSNIEKIDEIKNSIQSPRKQKNTKIMTELNKDSVRRHRKEQLNQVNNIKKKKEFRDIENMVQKLDHLNTFMKEIDCHSSQNSIMHNQSDYLQNNCSNINFNKKLDKNGIKGIKSDINNDSQTINRDTYTNETQSQKSSDMIINKKQNNHVIHDYKQNLIFHKEKQKFNEFNKYRNDFNIRNPKPHKKENLSEQLSKNGQNQAGLQYFNDLMIKNKRNKNNLNNNNSTDYTINKNKQSVPDQFDYDSILSSSKNCKSVNNSNKISPNVSLSNDKKTSYQNLQNSNLLSNKNHQQMQISNNQYESNKKSNNFKNQNIIGDLQYDKNILENNRVAQNIKILDNYLKTNSDAEYDVY